MTNLNRACASNVEVVTEYNIPISLPCGWGQFLSSTNKTVDRAHQRFNDIMYNKSSSIGSIVDYTRVFGCTRLIVDRRRGKTKRLQKTDSFVLRRINILFEVYKFMYYALCTLTLIYDPYIGTENKKRDTTISICASWRVASCRYTYLSVRQTNETKR